MKLLAPAILLIYFLLPHVLTAQNIEKDTLAKNRIDIGIGIGVGQGIAFNSFATINLPSGLYTGLHSHLTFLHSKEEPADYQGGFEIKVIFSSGIPKDFFAAQSIILGKRFKKPNPNLSFSLETGLSWIMYNKVFFKPHQSAGFISLASNYTTNRELQHNAGIMFGGKISYHMSPKTCLDFYTYSNFNSIRTVITENISIVLSFGKSSKKVK